MRLMNFKLKSQLQRFVCSGLCGLSLSLVCVSCWAAEPLKNSDYDELLRFEKERLEQDAKDTPFSINRREPRLLDKLMSPDSKPSVIDLARWYGLELDDYIAKPMVGPDRANRAYSLALETIEMSIDGEPSVLAPTKILNMLAERNDESIIHKELLNKALRLMNIAFKFSVESKSTVERENMLCLAALRDWSGDTVGASEIYGWLSPALKSRSEITGVNYEPQDFDVLAYLAVMNARRNDWHEVMKFETLCTLPKAVVLNDALMRVYKNCGKTEDLMRLYRSSYQWEQSTPDVFESIIQAAADGDREKIAASIKRKSVIALRVCLELQKHGWLAEALQVALKQPGSDVHERVRDLAASKDRDSMVRLAAASSVVHATGNIRLLRFILRSLREAVLKMPKASDDELDFNGRFCSIVVNGLSDCQDAECIMLLKELGESRDRMSELSTKEDFRILALKMQAGGESLLSIGSYAESLKMLTKALEMRRKCLPKDDLHIAETMETLAQVNARLNKNATADSLFQECIEFHRKNHHDPQLKSALQNYGSFLNSIGQTRKAAAIYKQSLETGSNR